LNLTNDTSERSENIKEICINFCQDGPHLGKNIAEIPDFIKSEEGVN
jgi:hypothetical protein